MTSRFNKGERHKFIDLDGKRVLCKVVSNEGYDPFILVRIINGGQYRYVCPDTERIQNTDGNDTM